MVTFQTDTEIFSKNAEDGEKYPQIPVGSPGKNNVFPDFLGGILDFASLCLRGHMTISCNLLALYLQYSVQDYRF